MNFRLLVFEVFSPTYPLMYAFIGGQSDIKDEDGNTRQSKHLEYHDNNLECRLNEILSETMQIYVSQLGIFLLALFFLIFFLF